MNKLDHILVYKSIPYDDKSNPFIDQSIERHHPGNISDSWGYTGEELEALEYDPFLEEDAIEVWGQIDDFFSFDQSSIKTWNDIKQKFLLNEVYQTCKPVQYDLIRDKKMLNAISVFVEFKMSNVAKCRGYVDKGALWDIYWNIIIDAGKKWMNLECGFIAELIELYECYYFNVYVMNDIKQQCKNTKLKSNDLSISHKFRFDVDLYGEKWDIKYEKRLSSLLEKIKVECSENVDALMNNLGIVLDFVKIKYQMLKSQVQYIL